MSGSLDGINFNVVNWQNQYVPINSSGNPIPTAQELHCIINILDSYKDARVTTGTFQSNLFQQSIQNLFPCYGKTNGGQVELHSLENDIMNKQNNLFANEMKLTALSKKAKNDTVNAPNIPLFNAPLISPTYRNALNDAAITPSDFNPSIEEIETPGSYIDPGGRKVGKVWPALDKPLSIDLTAFGFNNVIFSSKFIVNDPEPPLCEIQMSHNGVILFNKTIDRRGNYQVDNGVNYVGGNDVKNNLLINNAINIDQAKTLVLCKELGDTLQVIMGHIMIQLEEFSKLNLAAFTGDIPFACRCLTLGVPVLMKKISSKGDNAALRSFSFYIPQTDPIAAQLSNNECIINEYIDHNSSVAIKINKFLIEGADKQAEFTGIDTNTIRDFFNGITAQIGEINTYYGTILTANQASNPPMSTDILKNELGKFRVFDVITVIGKNNKLKLNIALKSLFLDTNPDGTISPDYIKTNCVNKKLGEYFTGLKYARKIRGGKKIYSGGDPEYNNLMNVNNANDNFFYELVPEFYFDIFYNYFKYVGDTIYDDEFLSYCLKIFLNGDEDFPSLEAFKADYTTYIHSFKSIDFSSFDNNEIETEKPENNSLEILTDLFINKLQTIVVANNRDIQTELIELLRVNSMEEDNIDLPQQIEQPELYSLIEEEQRKMAEILHNSEHQEREFWIHRPDQFMFPSPQEATAFEEPNIENSRQRQYKHKPTPSENRNERHKQNASRRKDLRGAVVGSRRPLSSYNKIEEEGGGKRRKNTRKYKKKANKKTRRNSKKTKKNKTNKKKLVKRKKYTR